MSWDIMRYCWVSSGIGIISTNDQISWSTVTYYMVSFGSIKYHLVWSCIIWYPQVSLGVLRCRQASSSIMRYHKVLLCVIRYHQVSQGIIRNLSSVILLHHQVSVWYRLVSPGLKRISILTEGWCCAVVGMWLQKPQPQSSRKPGHIPVSWHWFHQAPLRTST